MNIEPVVILGAGISGLATAFWLKKAGYEVLILEAKSEPGGAMITASESGFLIDFGPNSGLETTPLIAQIAEEVGLKDQMIYANKQADKRYILKGGELMALPTSPALFLRTNLFSLKAKLRIMKEPFIGKSKDGYYQSIAEFVKRRLGQEFLDYAIDPFVSGVFAGNPEKLSVKSAFPKLYRLEEVYGGLIKGMIKGAKERREQKKRNETSKQSAKMFSFIGGMQTFPEAIAKHLGECVRYNTEICKIEKIEDKYVVTVNTPRGEEKLHTKYLLSTIPAYKLANIISAYSPELEKHLKEIIYPPVLVLYIGFKKNDISRSLDGFGFLIPSKEKKNFLGAIWSSTIFQNRSNDENAAFTLFVGGARRLDYTINDAEEMEKNALKEFKEIMGINSEPVYITRKFWQKAIPQYNLGYVEHDNMFEKFEMKNKGFILSGNYRGGISVGDCMKNSEITANRMIEILQKKEK